MKKIISLAAFLSIFTLINAQSYLEWDSYLIDKFYEKVDLKVGTLDEYGQPIYHIYQTTEIEEGVYEIEIADGNGNLYGIKGANYYLTNHYE